ncbi:Crp/Fnr family transcriptional regulator [Methylobacterium terricola]|uniref:Crp/Fnr family transcriptional regulator n=1 Tax=Methylobacterium terricola TaxID=2583531 RepID=A0A5C4L6E7_9HYPH|nr:Crp/Fnr family transcriptional regulator [Methylobacterium terricola]TNC05410.1 Crp/Fnr family transcriptional regulator [Methylobacterium terricola]
MSGFKRVEPIRIPVPQLNQHHRHVLIRKLDRLIPLAEIDASALANLSVGMRQVGPRTDLLHEGDTPDEVILMLDGFAARCKFQPTGKRQILAHLLPGDLCEPDAGYLSRLDFSVCTLSACMVAFISRRALASTLERYPATAHALRLVKLQEEAISREWLVNVGCRSALERMAHLLCELLVRLQAVGFATRDGYGLPITQQDLGDTLGLSNVHVNRTLKVMRDQNLVEWRGRQLKILDLSRLQVIAAFKLGYLHSTAGHDILAQ